MGAMALDAILAPGLDGELSARLLELTSDVAAAVDRDGVVVQANPALARAAGRDPAGLGAELLVHPEDRFRARAAVRRVLDGEMGVELELRVGSRVTGWRWVLVTLGADRIGGLLYGIGKDVTEYRRSERRLARAEDIFRSLAGAAPNGVFAADARGEASYVNERLAQILGRDGEELLGRGWLAAIPGDERARLRGAGRDGPVELRVVRPGGDERWIRTHVSPVGPGPAGYVGAVEDVTEEVRARRELAGREAELRMLAENSSDFLSRHAPDGTFLYASPASRRLLGREPGHLVGKRGIDLVLAEDRRAVAAAARSAGGLGAVTYRVRRTDGAIVWFESTLRALEGGEIVAVSRDVSARKAAELELAHQALHDALTGLPNRVLFLDRLKHALAGAKRRGAGATAVFFLDVDRFKLVNDSLGHDAGDELLVDVARRLGETLRPADTVARFGGDEFTVLCEDLADGDEAEAIAGRIVDVFAEPFVLAGGEVFLSTSVGIALAGGPDERPEDLIRDADAAMYRAKERGKARFEVFDEDMRATATHRLELETALRRALEHGELRVHYQPALDLARREVVGCEALVRWEHPERGLLAPAEFVPLAEETGLIVPLGAWVLREACRTAAGWPEERDVAVNLTARQIAQPDVVAVVAGALAEAGLEPARLCLELTESGVLGAGAAETLRALKALGVKLAIDDFGTGWSSLGHLRSFPLDVVKLDRSFVAGLGTAPRDDAIAEAVISLAHALGLSTVAEGVETEGQRAVLERLGCDTAQGYLFGRPAP
jgi:diguanylate cyclase (GGDEF)-like protein/PAS domain S-box-containing protein